MPANTPANATLAERVTAPALAARKRKRQPIVVVTAYDAPQGRLAAEAGADAILVGDSVGMTTLGFDTTLPVTLEIMLHHTRAVARGVATRPACGAPGPGDVARGARQPLLVADLPFGAYGAT